MKFQEYLQRTIDVSTAEKNVLDQLCEFLAAGKELDQIQIRAAKSALQVLIENTIGKGKQILKHFQCPMVFHKGKEVFWVLSEVGVIDEKQQGVLTQAIGFRNSMIHDYGSAKKLFHILFVKCSVFGTFTNRLCEVIF
jgi:uncharacterized protein YutE (UPF0331/DUF86 family)